MQLAGPRGFTGTVRKTEPVRWTLLPVACLLLLLIADPSRAENEDTSLKPSIPPKKDHQQPRHDMFVVGSTAIIETEQSQACAKRTQNSPLFVRDFKRCLLSTAASQGAERIARSVIGVGSTTVPETKNSLHCLGISEVPEKFWKCMRKIRKSTTTIAPGMPWFNSIDAHTLLSKFVGDTAVLRCTVENKGDRDVSWMRTGPHADVIFVGDAMFHSDSKYKIETDNNRTFHLRIERLTRADNGTYACIVNTKPPISWNVSLQIVSVATVKDVQQVSPTVAENKKRMFVFNESDIVELKCIGEGIPAAGLTWIGPTGERMGYTTLRIDGINRTQDGDYRCEADNGLNDVPDVRFVTIKVNYMPEIRLYQTDVEIRKAVGGYVKMICRADASPRVTFTWRKDGVLVPPSSRITNRQQQTILVIVSIEPHHYGVYTCEATNLLGTAQANITLNGKPLSPTIISDSVGTRKHTFKLTWLQPSNQPPNHPGTIPVNYYKVMYRGWWRQSTKDRKKVFSLDDEANMLEEIIYPDPNKVRQICSLHDLRPNATYALQLYAVNDQGESDPVNFTFYTALARADYNGTEDEVTTSNEDATGPLPMQPKNQNLEPIRGERIWTPPDSAAPQSTPSMAMVLTMSISLVMGLHCREVYK
ncbi:roundabout homolog 2-like isoform X4 [Acanthaster planci]|uniref:Roundabout homolog 2-like isoform X4 n=1 Tax=Acanthaster planci TaxID=133434 RepID=A0A8B7Y5Q4_ACAPL|nr:roundabout homolog 2-like isoform X4 [Acanthaster planci]